MKTKEEILKEVSPNIDAWLDYSALLNALDEFAKQQVIEFGKWTIAYAYENDPKAKRKDEWKNWDYGSDEVFTTEQLYDLYKIKR